MSVVFSEVRLGRKVSRKVSRNQFLRQSGSANLGLIHQKLVADQHPHSQPVQFCCMYSQFSIPSGRNLRLGSQMGRQRQVTRQWPWSLSLSILLREHVCWAFLFFGGGGPRFVITKIWLFLLVLNFYTCDG